MALTQDQTLALFDILDVPYFDGTNSAGYNTMDGMGALSVGTQLAAASQNQAVNGINTWITNMSAGTLANLAALLDSYIALGYTRTKIVNGSLGDGGLTGVDYDPQADRAEIADRVRRRCPFYPFNIVEDRINNGTGRINREVPLGF